MASNALLAKLNAARERLKRASALVKDLQRGEAWNELQAARADLNDLEREVALADGLECAIACPTIPLWDLGAPMPTLVSGLSGIALVYAAKSDPKSDGASLRAAKEDETWKEVPLSESPTLDNLPASEAWPRGVVVLRFVRPAAVKLGSPNDEVLDGHPLFGKGLAAYRPHTIVNSSWIRELRQINSVHVNYDATRWDAFTHYLLTFHDETFECIAEGVKSELRTGSIAEAARAVLEEVLGAK